jgi:hypothetical protein
VAASHAQRPRPDFPRLSGCEGDALTPQGDDADAQYKYDEQDDFSDHGVLPISRAMPFLYLFR